jgi:hypothetical protein
MIFHDLDSLLEAISQNKMITVELDESQRQMVLMALAALAIERPGWDMALSAIALKMDNVQTTKQRRLDALHCCPGSVPGPRIALGKPVMYETFKAFRAGGLAKSG